MDSGWIQVASTASGVVTAIAFLWFFRYAIDKLSKAVTSRDKEVVKALDASTAQNARSSEVIKLLVEELEES